MSVLLPRKKNLGDWRMNIYTEMMMMILLGLRSSTLSLGAYLLTRCGPSSVGLGLTIHRKRPVCRLRWLARIIGARNVSAFVHLPFLFFPLSSPHPSNHPSTHPHIPASVPPNSRFFVLKKR